MSFAKKTIEGFDKLIRRNREMAGRIKALERRMAVLDGLAGGVVRNKLAPLTAPGSPVNMLGEWLVATIIGEHPEHVGERVYQATVCEPTAHGIWAPIDLSITVIGYPLSGTGEQASERPMFGEGEYVLVRWDGRDPVNNIDFYHAQSMRTNNFSGKVTACDRVSGFAKVRRGSGTLGSLTVDAEDEEVVVWCGKYPFLRVDDNVTCVDAGPGVTPKYTVIDRVSGVVYTEPTVGSLCDTQDNGGGMCSNCCNSTVGAS